MVWHYTFIIVVFLSSNSLHVLALVWYIGQNQSGESKEACNAIVAADGNGWDEGGKGSPFSTRPIWPMGSVLYSTLLSMLSNSSFWCNLFSIIDKLIFLTSWIISFIYFANVPNLFRVIIFWTCVFRKYTVTCLLPERFERYFSAHTFLNLNCLANTIKFTNFVCKRIRLRKMWNTARDFAW